MQLLAPIILIVISGGLFMMWIDPEYQEIKEKQAEKARYDETLAKTVEIREFRQNIESKYELIDERDLERLDKMLPTHIDNIRLILDINNVANARSMTIRDIRIDLADESGGDSEDIAVTDGGGFGSVGFRFTVVTTYENFKDFLDDLALSLRVVDVTSVGISEIEDEENFYRFDVGIRTYWLPKS